MGQAVRNLDPAGADERFLTAQTPGLCGIFSLLILAPTAVTLNPLTLAQFNRAPPLGSFHPVAARSCGYPGAGLGTTVPFCRRMASSLVHQRALGMLQSCREWEGSLGPRVPPHGVRRKNSQKEHLSHLWLRPVGMPECKTALTCHIIPIGPG